MQSVLIVDDLEDNRVVLMDALEGEGYVLSEACDGAEALEAVASEPPDIILLDIMMPNMDGIECCARLQANEDFKHIPILLITALVEDDQIVLGLDAGATDYIPKPFSYLVIRARVRAALRSKLAHDRLDARNREILQLAYAMSHDLQTPLATLTGAVDTLALQLANSDDEKVAKWMDRIVRANQRMVTMLGDLMAYAKAGTQELREDVLDLSRMFSLALELLQSQAEEKHIRIELSCDNVYARGDESTIPRVLTNLIGNAIKYHDDEVHGLITIAVTQDDYRVRITIADNGPGIPPDQLENVFLPFKRATAAQKGTGLGLSIVRKFVEAQAGRVWLESDGHRGTTAILELPKASARERAKSRAA